MMRRENRTEGSSTAKLSPNDYIIRELERIDQGIYTSENTVDEDTLLISVEVLMD